MTEEGKAAGSLLYLSRDVEFMTDSKKIIKEGGTWNVPLQVYTFYLSNRLTIDYDPYVGQGDIPYFF